MGQRIGVVLAGGQGRRYGRTKGDLVLEGRTLAERAASALWPLCGSVVISIRPGMRHPAPMYPAVEDRVLDRGPLAGLDAVFASTGDADLLVLACDYPGVGAGELSALLAAARDGDDLVLWTDPAGRDHPLVALWRRTAAPAVAEAVIEGALRVRAVLAALEVRRLRPVDHPGLDLVKALRNVNHPDDFPALGDSQGLRRRGTVDREPR